MPEDVRDVGRNQLEATIDWWQTWVRGLSIPFEWQEAVIRSAITLKLCNYEETGAIVAALTTSIPEAPNTERNWDYRYCWIRDSFFVIRVLNALGVTRTMEDYIRFITDIVDDASDGGIQPVYSITRESYLEEAISAELPGYRGMGPVRIGNQAYVQVQNDVYGSLVLACTHVFFDKRLIRQGANAALFEQLEAIGFEIHDSGSPLQVAVPGFRPDVEREIDLIEEIARLAGFARLPSTLPPARAGGLDAYQAADRRLRRALAGFGLAEAWTSSFGSPSDLDALGLPPDHPARSAVALENPTSELDPVLRTTLLPGLLRSAAA